MVVSKLQTIFIVGSLEKDSYFWGWQPTTTWLHVHLTLSEKMVSLKSMMELPPKFNSLELGTLTKRLNILRKIQVTLKQKKDFVVWIFFGDGCQFTHKTKQESPPTVENMLPAMQISNLAHESQLELDKSERASCMVFKQETPGSFGKGL